MGGHDRSAKKPKECHCERIKMGRVVEETQRRIRQGVKFTQGNFQDSP